MKMPKPKPHLVKVHQFKLCKLIK